MNLFEALRLGDGKATFKEVRNISYWFIAAGKLMCCHEGKMSPAAEEGCLYTDWIPYVPCETLPVCGNCGQKLPPAETKTKHKAVSRVKWESEIVKTGGMVCYPVFIDQINYTKYELTKKPEMTMTLEWEE